MGSKNRKEYEVKGQTKASKRMNYINHLTILNSEYGHIESYLAAIRDFLNLLENALDVSYKVRCEKLIPSLDLALLTLDPRFDGARGLYNFFLEKMPSKSWPNNLKVLERICEENGLGCVEKNMITLREAVIKIASIFPMEEVQNIKCSIVSNEALSDCILKLYITNHMQQQEISRYKDNPEYYGLNPSIFYDAVI